MSNVLAGIDIGTTKICTVIGEVLPDHILIHGVGVAPSAGMRNGAVIDVGELSQAIIASKTQAEKTSGYDINSAYVGSSGSHVATLTGRGKTAIVPYRRVQQEDLDKAMELARTVAIHHNRQILHVVPRSYKIDDDQVVENNPIGMHTNLLEVDAAIIITSSTNLANLEEAVNSAGITVDEFMLSSLAACETVLTSQERELGAVVIDIGGGTTDLAIYIGKSLCHTAVIPSGGNYVTKDIAYLMRVIFEIAEVVKIERGHANMDDVAVDEYFTVAPEGGDIMEFSRRDLAMAIEARLDEILDGVAVEIRRSGYAGLLHAGAVITGGTSQIPGFQELAARKLGLPVRLAQPENLQGLTDTVMNPAYSASIGLLRLGLLWGIELEHSTGEDIGYTGSPWMRLGKSVVNYVRRFIPQDE